jgi:hypothetical protein
VDRPENEVGKDESTSDPDDVNIGADNKRPSPESNSGADERSVPKKDRSHNVVFSLVLKKKFSRTYTTQTSQSLEYEIHTICGSPSIQR